MKKILFLCNTSYQIFVAVTIKNAFWKNDIADIIISDHIVERGKVAKNLRKSNYFRNIFEVDIKSEEKNTLLQKVCFQISKKENFKYIESKIRLDDVYDIVLMANLFKFNKLLCRRNYILSQKKKIDTRIFLFEDGLVTYSKEFYNNILRFNRRNAFSNTDSFFYGALLFNPEILEWQHERILKIPKKSIENVKDILNIIFEYDECKKVDKYSQKVIFFEESYFTDGKDIDDLSIVNMISEVVGKENMMIKIHPRNSINRFNQLGYTTNKNTFVPWELVLLNENMNDKILFTITSNAIANPFLVFGRKIKAIYLFDILENKVELNTNFLPLLQKLNKIYGERIFVFLKNKSQLEKIINIDKAINQKTNQDIIND